MSLIPAHPLPPFPDFATASREVVGFLTRTIPLAVWSVNRAEGDLMVVLRPSEPNSYGIRSGDALPYDETMCARMVAGLAPNIAPDVNDFPAYRDTPGRKLAPINTYVSFPLQRADGGLFGTLCGFDPIASPPSLLDHQALIEILSRQLSTILQFDLDREAAWRLALQHEASAMTDALTGIPNRRAFEMFCDHEETRCRDLGQRLSVILIDLDGLKSVNDRQGHQAGDQLIRRAAQAIRARLPVNAHVARTGGDEFIALLPGSSLVDASAIAGSLREHLATQDIEASMGCAERKAWRGLADALKRADAAMYEDKRLRRAVRA